MTTDNWQLYKFPADGADLSADFVLVVSCSWLLKTWQRETINRQPPTTDNRQPTTDKPSLRYNITPSQKRDLSSLPSLSVTQLCRDDKEQYHFLPTTNQRLQTKMFVVRGSWFVVTNQLPQLHYRITPSQDHFFTITWPLTTDHLQPTTDNRLKTTDYPNTASHSSQSSPQY